MVIGAYVVAIFEGYINTKLVKMFIWVTNALMYSYFVEIVFQF